MNAVIPGSPSNSDGFPLEISSTRVSHGTPARWTETTGWRDRDGLPIPDTMLVIYYFKALRSWVNKRATYNIDDPLPNLDELNASIPRSEWPIGLSGEPEKPWKFVYVFYLVDFKTGTMFTYEHDTFGAMLCYDALHEAVTVQRMLRGSHVFPVVHMEQRPWKSARFGPQMRAHLQPTGDWRTPGNLQPVLQAPAPQISGPTTTAASTPTPTTPVTPANTSPASAPTPPPADAASPSSTILDHMTPVKPVTVAEAIADKLPDWA